MQIAVNGAPQIVKAAADTPLLWVLRDELGLMGTKYGCGVALCGACTVHVDGQAVRWCQVPVGTLEGAAVVTIEDLVLSPLSFGHGTDLLEKIPMSKPCGRIKTQRLKPPYRDIGMGKRGISL
ncbi:2Fe-2S iron-sulfur cluster-binding protein [Rhabdaerophilum sp. SD176]|uniref:(2Fe-2S)-binding protein n=1 Tax=Rhabdaerophilum sp. SD176 TaxID=2983548 RepID=UPI0024DF6BE6|nr:2Fe-2S iron-sulfur cluster-binding protein [Rhabdaerophilum sp. SD176]